MHCPCRMTSFSRAVLIFAMNRNPGFIHFAETHKCSTASNFWPATTGLCSFCRLHSQISTRKPKGYSDWSFPCRWYNISMCAWRMKIQCAVFGKTFCSFAIRWRRRRITSELADSTDVASPFLSQTGCNNFLQGQPVFSWTLSFRLVVYPEIVEWHMWSWFATHSQRFSLKKKQTNQPVLVSTQPVSGISGQPFFSFSSK